MKDCISIHPRLFIFQLYEGISMVISFVHEIPDSFSFPKVRSSISFSLSLIKGDFSNLNFAFALNVVNLKILRAVSVQELQEALPHGKFILQNEMTFWSFITS